LFLAVFDEVQQQLPSSLSGAQLTAGDPLTDLQHVLLGFLDVVAAVPDIQALLVDGPALFGPTRWLRAEQARGPAPIEARIRDAIEAGVIDDRAQPPAGPTPPGSTSPKTDRGPEDSSPGPRNLLQH